MLKSKKCLIILIVVVVLVFGFGFYLYSELAISKKPWSVVYVTTGEIYIGKLSSFPRFQLFDAYLLQVVKKPGAETDEGVQEETQFQLTPLKDALWAPKKLYLNKEQVVFYGPVREDSRVAEVIREAGK